ncbi:MAG: phage holin family protein [Acidobacteria bacterium]|nr:phage holin family protein [Acidobacteriota bacterium]
MQNFLIRLVVNALALSAAAWLLGGITLSGGLFDIVLVALIFGLLNALLKPILLFFSLPFLIVTLGLFAFVVNAVVLLITASLSSALTVDGFVSALLGSLVVSVVTMLLGSLNDDVK